MESERVPVRMSPYVLSLLDDICECSGMNRSEVVRALICAFHRKEFYEQYQACREDEKTVLNDQLQHGGVSSE